MKKSNYKVSVIMCTLGRDKILDTINAINTGNFIPTEILICIPETHKNHLPKIKDKNTRIIYTKYKGLVAQRSEGLKQAKEKLVMQLDDDVILKVNTLSLMIDAIFKLGAKNVVGPVFINHVNGNPLSPFPNGFRGLISDIYHLIGGLPLGKKRMGKMSSICVCTSIDPEYFSDNIVGTEWLAGGCVLGFRDELITNNFFPFEGKAYAEDLLNSYLRKMKGINHNVIIDAHALTDSPPNDYNFKEFFREMYVHLTITKIMKGNIFRKTIFIFLEILRKIVLGFKYR